MMVGSKHFVTLIRIKFMHNFRDARKRQINNIYNMHLSPVMTVLLPVLIITFKSREVCNSNF